MVHKAGRALEDTPIARVTIIGRNRGSHPCHPRPAATVGGRPSESGPNFSDEPRSPRCGGGKLGADEHERKFHRNGEAGPNGFPFFPYKGSLRFTPLGHPTHDRRT